MRTARLQLSCAGSTQASRCSCTTNPPSCTFSTAPAHMSSSHCTRTGVAKHIFSGEIVKNCSYRKCKKFIRWLSNLCSSRNVFSDTLHPHNVIHSDQTKEEQSGPKSPPSAAAWTHEGSFSAGEVSLPVWGIPRKAPAS